MNSASTLRVTSIPVMDLIIPTGILFNQELANRPGGVVRVPADSEDLGAKRLEREGGGDVHENKRQCNTIWYNTWCRVRRPASNTGEAER